MALELDQWAALIGLDDAAASDPTLVAAIALAVAYNALRDTKCGILTIPTLRRVFNYVLQARREARGTLDESLLTRSGLIGSATVASGSRPAIRVKRVRRRKIRKRAGEEDHAKS